MDEEEQIRNTLPEGDKQTLKDEGIEIMGKDTPADRLETTQSAPVEKIAKTKEQPETQEIVKGAIAPEKIIDKKDDTVKAIRTYKGDMAEAVEHNHISSIKMAAAESDRRSNTPIEREIPKHRGILFAAIGIIILATVIGIGGYIFFKNNSETTSSGQAVPQSLVEVNGTRTVSIESGEGVTTDFTAKIKSLAIPVGSLVQILPLSQNNNPVATSSNFFNALGVNVPTQILESLDGTFTLGAYASEENHPFLILGIKSFDNAFPGMLSWEETMPDDLGFLIAIDHPNITSNGTGPIFSDKIILNKDVRELDDASNTPELMYSFTDTNTLVITTDKDTMMQIITELNTAKVAR